MQHIVFYSGGIGSWAATKRLLETIQPKDVLLLFTDTNMEDIDLYRFLHETSLAFGVELCIIEDGRTPWEIFEQNKFLGNSQVDLCSRILKRELSKTWITNRFSPDDCILYVGIDWTEEHRYKAALWNWLPYMLKAPLCEPPYLEKTQIFEMLAKEGIRKPDLYEKGFAHNNCGGFCVKAGMAHFEHLLKTKPETYAFHEAKEQDLRNSLGKNVSIMRSRKGGKVTPLTMREFRLNIESIQVDPTEIGGCGCFSDE